MRRLASANGNDLWSGSPPAPPADGGASYWMAVATSGGKTIASTGDLTPLLSPLLPYTRRTTDNSQDVPPGTIVEDWSEARNDAGVTNGRGQAVGIDSAGNVYAGGYYTRAGSGRDMMLLRYPQAGPPASVPFPTAFQAGDDEILDLAVDTDDSVWVVGYETVTSPAQGRNIVLYHISAAGALLLKRTFDGGVGDDRAVSVVLSSGGGKNFVYVVGEQTVAGPETDVLVRKYVR